MLQEFSFSRLFIVLFGKLRYTSTVSVMNEFTNLKTLKNYPGISGHFTFFLNVLLSTTNVDICCTKCYAIN